MLGAIRRARRALRYRLSINRRLGGTRPFECPACGYNGPFKAHGSPPRFDAVCRNCGAMERHRLFVLVADRLDPPLAGDAVHFAPEPQIARFLKPRLQSYRGADIRPGRADIVLNLEEIDLPDCSLDLIVANHVLEHVDDRKTLAEFHRVLRPGGRAVLMFPIIEGWDETYENAAITSPEDRELHFGQWDHVRYFGRDVRDRIRAAGFLLDEYTSTPDEVVRYRTGRGERVFVATRESLGAASP